MVDLREVALARDELGYQPENFKGACEALHWNADPPLNQPHPKDVWISGFNLNRETQNGQLISNPH